MSAKLVTLTVRNLNSFVRDKLYIGLLFHHCVSSLCPSSISFWSRRCNAHNIHPCSFSYPPIQSTCQVFYFITMPSARSALIEWAQRRSFLSVCLSVCPSVRIFHRSNYLTRYFYRLSFHVCRTWVPPIWQQIIGNRSNHYHINHNSLMTRRNPGRNFSWITHKNSNRRITMRNNSIYCIRIFILRIIFMGILPYKTVVNDWTWINLTTHRYSTVQPNTSPVTKYSNPLSLGSNCNMGTPRPTKK